MQSATLIVLFLLLTVSSTFCQIETNTTLSPDSVPHGEPVIINCGFNIPLDSVGLISIEKDSDDQLYEYQPDTGGVIGEDYEDKIISDEVDEGFVRLVMIVDMVIDTTTFFCVLIDENFDTYMSSADLFVELPLVQLTTDPGYIRHGDRVTVRCEFAALPDNLWNRLSLGMTSTTTELLFSQNAYPNPGKTTRRFGNDVSLGYYEMITADFTDNSVEGTFVANYLIQTGQNLTCSLTDFLGNISQSSTSFNVFTDHYMTITPNPAVVGQEVEFRCSYGYFVDYITYIYWEKDEVLIISINAWGTASTFTLDGILTSTEGEGYHSFTKIATADDAGYYGCFANTAVGSEVGYKYINLTVVDMDEEAMAVAPSKVNSEKKILSLPEEGHVVKEAAKIKSKNRNEPKLKN